MKVNEILTYKQICLEMGDKEEAGGEHRKRQLNKWNKVAEVEKVGRGKYIIKRQFSVQEIQERDDELHYSKFLQNMLLRLFSKMGDNKQTYTYRKLREYLAMVNQHYFPVKYGNESISLKVDCKINLGNLFIDEELAEGENNRYSVANQEKCWFEIADSHDKDALKYALNALYNRGLLADVKYTYSFYSRVKGASGYYYTVPQVASDDCLAEIAQRQMEFLKSNLTAKELLEIDNKAEIDKLIGIDKENKIFGLYQQAVFKKGDAIRSQYYKIPESVAIENGHTNYTQSVTIIKPSRLETLIDTFAPKFNPIQVKRYLNSKRFKNIPRELHEQLTNELIKI